MKLFHIKKIILPIIFYSLFIAISADAATAYFKSSSNEYGVGDIFKSTFRLNTENQTINACDFKLTFDTKSLAVLDIGTGDSLLTLWPEKPYYSNEKGEIDFTGGTPKGFEGDGVLVTVIFQASQPGMANVSVKTGSVFLNDGLGTKTNLTTNDTSFNIIQKNSQPIDEWTQALEADLLSPEPFKIILSRDPLLFDGKYFIVFSATDKQSGINNYQIKEGNSDWQTGESPYLLQNQDDFTEIYVKATDKAGNERIEKYSLKTPLLNYLIAAIFGGILILIIIVLLIKKLKKSETT